MYDWLLFVARCVWFVVGCLLSVLFVSLLFDIVRCLSLVVRCLWYVVC